MKTLYTQVGRIQLPDRTVALVEKASQEVYRLASMHHWQPSIKMGLPQSVLQRWELDDRISPYISPYDGEALEIDIWGFYRRSKSVKREVRANLGYETQTEDGFESQLLANLFEFDDVYFDELIPQYLLIGHMPLNQRNIGLIHIEHWNKLAGMLQKAASMRYQSRLIEKSDKEFYKRVMKRSRAFIESGKADDLEGLIETLKPSQQI